MRDLKLRTLMLFAFWLGLLLCLGLPTPGEAAWNDDFESYPAGTFPNPPWINSGNTEAFIDNTKGVSGIQSFKLFGVLASCWGALAHREITVSAPFIIEANVYNGSETLSGCHSAYGAVLLSTGPSWTTSHRNLIQFDVDDRTGEKIIRGSGCLSDDPVDCINLGPYVQETWYKVKIQYEIVNAATVRLSYWINDIFKGSHDFPSSSYEQDLSYVTISAGEGSAWFDDVKILLPLIEGCIKLEGLPLAGRKVILKQRLEPNQTATTDANGCYKFDNAVPGKTFKVIISGPVVP